MRILQLITWLFLGFSCLPAQSNMGINRSIFYIAKDTQSRIWLATSTGLFRYSGEWSNLSEDTQSPFYGIDWVNIVDSIKTDKYHFVFVGTENDGVYIHDVVTGKTHHLLNELDVTAILPNDKGVYLGSDQGLYFYDYELQYTKELVSKHYIQKLDNYAGKVVIASDQGIGFLGDITPYKPKNTTRGIKNLAVVDHHIYATSDQGLLKYNTELELTGHFFEGEPLNAIALTPSNKTLWLGGNNRLLKFDTRTHKELPHGLTNNCLGRIFSLLIHGETDVWVGSENKLTRLSRGVRSNNCIYNYFLAHYKENQYFVVTEGEGITLYDTQNKTGRAYPSPLDFKNLIINRVGFAFGHLIIASNKGVKLINIEGSALSLPDSLANSYALFADQLNDDQLVVATNRKGFFTYSPITGQHTLYSQKDGLESNEVLYVYEDSQNDIWVANGTALSVKRADKNRFEKAFDVKSKIKSIVEDKKYIYVATHSKGFYQLNRDDFLIKRRFTSATSFMSNYTAGLFKYDNYLYFQTINEVQRFNLNTQRFEYRFPSPTRAFTNNTFFELSKEKALVATPDKGIGIVDLPTPMGDKGHSTIIMSIKVDGKESAVNDVLPLSHTDRLLEINFNRSEILPNTKLNCTLKINDGPEIKLVNGKYTHLLNNFHLGDSLDLVARCANRFGDWDDTTARLRIEAPASAAVISLAVALTLFVAALICWHLFRITPLRRQVFAGEARCHELESTMEVFGCMMPENINNETLYYGLLSLADKHQERYGVPVKMRATVSPMCNNIDAYIITGLTCAALSMAATESRKRLITVTVIAQGDKMFLSLVEEHDILHRHHKTNSQGWKNFMRCYEAFDREKWWVDLTVDKMCLGYRVRVELENKLRLPPDLREKRAQERIAEGLSAP